MLVSSTQREWRLLAAAGLVSIFLLYYLYLDSVPLPSQTSRDYRVGTSHRSLFFFFSFFVKMKMR
jgi:hypothetical protein